MSPDSPWYRSSIVPPEAPLANVPGSVYFWWAFFALGVVALGAGLWGLVWRRVRLRRLRAEMAQWPSAANAATQAAFGIELVRHHRLRAPAQWMAAVDRLQNSHPNVAKAQAEAAEELRTLRAEVWLMEYVD